MSLEWPRAATFPPNLAAMLAGRVFCGGYLWTAVADTASVRIHVAGGSHRSFVNTIITCAGQATVQPSSRTVYSNPGTSLGMFNRMQSSPNTATTMVYHTPTISTPGTNCAPVLVEGGSASGVGGVRTGAESSDDYGALLVQGDDILYTITNTSGAAMTIGVEIFATEFVE